MSGYKKAVTWAFRKSLDFCSRSSILSWVIRPRLNTRSRMFSCSFKSLFSSAICCSTSLASASDRLLFGKAQECKPFSEGDRQAGREHCLAFVLITRESKVSQSLCSGFLCCMKDANLGVSETNLYLSVVSSD